MRKDTFVRVWYEAQCGEWRSTDSVKLTSGEAARVEREYTATGHKYVQICREKYTASGYEPPRAAVARAVVNTRPAERVQLSAPRRRKRRPYYGHGQGV